MMILLPDPDEDLSTLEEKVTLTQFKGIILIAKMWISYIIAKRFR